MKSAIHTAIASCFVLFQVFGLAGYLYAYDACRGNIFLNFGECDYVLCSTDLNFTIYFSTASLPFYADPSDPLIIAGRLGMGVTLMFGLPLSILPCREAFLSLIPQLRRFWNEYREQAELLKKSKLDASMGNSSYAALPLNSRINTSYSSFASAEIDSKSCVNHVENAGTDSVSAEVVNDFDVEKSQGHAFQPEDEMLHDHNSPVSTTVHVCTTMAMTTFSFFGAVSVPGVAIVWCILGSSLGMLIAFITPCACYLKIRGRKGMRRRTNIGALALLIFSIVISVACTTQIILGILSESH